MTEFEVILTDRAEHDLDAAYEWFTKNAPHFAADWYDGFVKALTGLEQNPDRFGLAREYYRFPIRIRQLLYGVGKRKTHRAVFEIRQGRVVVYAIRHVSQRDLTPDDLI